jgi:hypothetical protein
MKEKKDHANYISSLDTLLPVLAVVSTLPTYLRNLFLMGGILMPNVWKALGALKDIEIAAETCVEERRNLLAAGESINRQDILASLMDIVHEKGDKVDFGMTEVKVEVYVAL